ncbi:MAG TPA: AAA family ATPase [Candidatus Binataceae bacterium]|nr:AAA family ATPase [Candidatus Binataceae bacterium]
MIHAGTVTLMFTDLVNSTELLHRAGDETAQRIFTAHHKLLSDAVAAHGGHEVKWLGDGLMVAFPSAAEAVRCAIAMQQGARRPTAGERLSLRVGLHVGDALEKESDYFGTAVVVARRLCERATSGQILCSALVAGLLAGRNAFDFKELGVKELKGLATPVAFCEVLYQSEDPAAMLSHTPFVGRASQVDRLKQKLAEVRAGRGALVMLVGEPGIGKTRTLEEFAELARNEHATVLWGRCYEGEWAPPFGPFSEAIAEYAHSAEPETLKRELGNGGLPLARLVPALRERLPELGEPVPLAPEEERFRLLDAVAQLLIAVSARAPLVLVLDDLHWADRGTIAMIRHVARFVARNRIMMLGAYRDVELDRQHPLAEALGALRREAPYERIPLKGLEQREVGELLATMAEHDVPEALVAAISAETDGNPFFIRELILHLVEEKKIFRQEGRWTSNLAVAEMGIPEGVRQVIGRRLSRLSEEANRLLAAASAFNGSFRFDIAASVIGLDETQALGALDEALAAQLLRSAAEAESYDFTHALIRHTLYAEMNPSRQVRLHRQIAEAMERAWANRVREHAAEVAYHFSRSSALEGAERGAEYAIAAADNAEAAYAQDEVVSFIRITLDLLPKDDERRPRLVARMGLALTWSLKLDEALIKVCEAAPLIAAAEGDDAAAAYMAEAADTMRNAGFTRGSWEVAKQGLRYAHKDDAAALMLTVIDIQREQSEDPNNPGMLVGSTPHFEELRSRFQNIQVQPRYLMSARGTLKLPESRQEALARYPDGEAILTFFAGEYRRTPPMWENRAAEAERQGAIANAILAWATAACCRNGLGELAAARAAYDRARALATRLPGPSIQAANLLAAADEICLARDERWEASLKALRPDWEQVIENKWFLAVNRAAIARIYAHLGRVEPALALLAKAIPAIELVTRGDSNYPRMICDAAATLWMLGRTDYIEVIERNLRQKVIAPDWRCPMHDARLSLARLCALQGRHDEAAEWFAKSRAVLEEQGQRPLLAIADFDEAWMYIRRNAPGDKERARPLLDAAMAQFKSIGMTGWLRRAEGLALGAN